MSDWFRTTTIGGDAPTTTPLRVARWSSIAAVHGTGSLLLGPHRRGAQAIIPPGVCARTPDGWADEYCEGGWRLAIWSFRPGDEALVEAHRPQLLETIPLLMVCSIVLEDAPEHRAWLCDQIELRARCLTVLVRAAELDSGQLASLRSELDDLVLDAFQILGQDWARTHVGSL